MLKTNVLALIAAASVAACATAPQLADDEVLIGPQLEVMCALEGGCGLISQARFEQSQRDAFQAGRASCRAEVSK